MKIKFKSFADLKEKANSSGLSLSKFLIYYEALNEGKDEEFVINRMDKTLYAMEEAIEKGLRNKNISKTGFVNGWAYQLKEYISNNSFHLLSPEFTEVILNTIAVSEMNACMGRIVAAPTAGSCGVLPGSLITIAKLKGVERQKLIEALFVAGGIGEVFLNLASLSGARHGCQAEVGAASSMASGAIVSLFSDDIDKIESASAFALKNVLGLVCDPIGGFVEIPCIKRNVMGAVNAIASAQMALAGINTIIPLDEVIIAMKRIGERLPLELRETGEGGIAATETAKRLLQKFKERQE
ncbi:L-serine ammonia-lyase, iron-sulfur-dependent, subunit alpha [Caldisericum exile]|uniref:L-serine dehydratase n=1 Tax=Caldisericum exile (strain DSM 21853 / NBRC 104410 / AZM16c01) TaxID=511051 RepID=A0A7U6GDY9_CALEA|nr:L-serine ammonia-lyase, iron-sulfur-dependent, subunit alpha [Caldisericum exile]BAL80634.1 L-serine dehydratase, alpha chain [Caldisericum exile AZM16c01]